MNRALILVVIFGFFFLLGNLQAQTCRETSVLEDISLPGQKADEGFENMMSIREGLEAFCTLNPVDISLFDQARVRLEFQDELIDILAAAGEIRPNGVRYYRGFFQDLLENLKACEVRFHNMRRRGIIFKPANLVDLNIRPTGIVDIYYKSTPQSFPYKRIISHQIWFGRIIEQDGFHLCATRVLN